MNFNEKLHAAAVIWPDDSPLFEQCATLLAHCSAEQYNRFAGVDLSQEIPQVRRDLLRWIASVEKPLALVPPQLCPHCQEDIMAKEAVMTRVEGRATLLCPCGKAMLLGSKQPRDPLSLDTSDWEWRYVGMLG